MESRKKLVYALVGLGVFFLIILIGFSLWKGRSTPVQFIKEDSAFGPVAEGTFYPADPVKLNQWIQSFIQQTPNFDASGRQLFGLIVPHAGYIYSGRTAATAFKLLQGKSIPRVVIMAPSHHAQAQEVSIPGYAYYQTNLGTIPIDREAVQKLKKGRPWITDNPNLYNREHALEVELPFLQTVLGKFQLVPLIIGDSNIELARKLAAALKETLGNDAFYIASTDLSHYHPYSQANIMDRKTLGLIIAKNPEKLSQAADAEGAELCGLGPVMTILSLFQDVPNGKVQLIYYENSGDVVGKKDSVVGYGALGLFY
jgi:AmmeMemoRadiSam system protein B